MKAGRWMLCSVLALCAACGKDATPAPAAPNDVEVDATPTRPPAAAEPSSTNVAIADDIRKACGISESEAFFAYDSARVRSADQVVLKKLATCFSTGPLRGREMRLVGHADSRGDDEYNYVLGQRRADSVKSAIVAQGAGSEKIATSSRGENDATGNDDSGWTKDRRVDVMLGQ